MRLSDLTWSSVFSSKHFVVSHHRQGRVFMAGDAAHIHSPVGGQGLNSGIQDAYNLMWKLALVQKGKARPKLLDSYSAERHETAEDLIAGVGTATKILTVEKQARSKSPRSACRRFTQSGHVRNWMGRDVAMLDIKYQAGPAAAKDRAANSVVHGVAWSFRWQRLSQGTIRRHAGTRMSSCREGNVPGNSLFDLFHGTQFTLMIFSGLTSPSALKHWCELEHRDTSTVSGSYPALYYFA